MSRIGMFTYSTQPRGSVVHAASLSEALCAQGHDVTLFALSKNGAGFFRRLDCELCLIPAADAPAELDRLIAQRIDELVAGLDAVSPELDILHAQDCLAASALLEARRRRSLAGGSLVRTVHHVERFESPYLADCQRRSILEADLVLAVSQLTAADVRREFGREPEQVQNGVDLSRFRERGHAAELRRRLGLDERDFVVLSVGGVEKRKNSLRCLEAMAILCADMPRAHWWIVGGASVLDHRSYQDEFEARLAGLPPDVRRRIQRLGIIGEQQLTELYAASDVLLCPSEQEGFGLCVLEAMAASVPVIVSNRAPFTEYVPERAALFVDPLDARDIGRALRFVAVSPEAALRLAELGTSVAAEFSWTRSAARHAELYERALAREGRSGRRLPQPPRVFAASGD